MKNVSRSSSSNRLSSCFRPDVDLDAAALHPPPHSLRRSSSSRTSCLPHPPKPTFSFLTKALNMRARHGSRRRSTSDDRNRTTPNQANIPQTKAEPQPSRWRTGSESENLSESCCSNKQEVRREKKPKCLGILMVVFSLTLTLTVMVGKFWGALLTSTCLYLFCLAKAGKENTRPKLWRRQVQVIKNRSAGKGCVVGS